MSGTRFAGAGRLLAVPVAATLSVLGVVAACSSFDGDAAPSDDASIPPDVSPPTDGDRPTDAAPDASDDADAFVRERPCAPDAAFGTPTMVAMTNANGAGVLGSAVYSATLSDNELVVIFEGTPSIGPNHPLYIARRTSIAEKFGDFAPITTLGTMGFSSTSPSLAGDENLLVYAAESDAGDAGPTTRPYISNRRAAGGYDTADPIMPNTLPTMTDLHLAHLLPDAGSGRNDEVWATEIDGGGAGKGSLFAMTRKNATATFQGVRPLMIDAPNPSNPVSTADRQGIYYRARGVATPGIWFSQRTVVDPNDAGPFDGGTPVAIPTIDTLELPEPMWASVNQCRLYFVAGAPTARRLYVVERPHLP